MSFETSTYQGDSDFPCNCTGDAVVGDVVRFERATFSGSYSRPKFDGFELITGEIVRESYGRDKQQHTFTLRLEGGGELRIKGRNLYKNGLYRKFWDDELDRLIVAEEKHQRGQAARAERAARLDENFARL